MKVVENWKPVVGYEGLYEVSDFGRVRSLNYNRSGEVMIMKFEKPKGYQRVQLSKCGKTKHFFVHRLVAFAFIPNPNNLPQVNHINEVKDDNRVVNLEWCTAEYNLNYGTHTERQIKTQTNRPDKSIPVVQLTLDYKFVTKWPSAMEVQRQGGFKNTNINACCKHKPKHKTTGGYRWLYLKEYEELCYKVITSQHPFLLALPYRA